MLFTYFKVVVDHSPYSPKFGVSMSKVLKEALKFRNALGKAVDFALDELERHNNGD